MPTISMFYGIIVRMYNKNEHLPPHFHAYYQDYVASFNFNGEILEGEMPKPQVKKIAAWAEIHKEELEANWKLVMAQEALYKIPPLR